MSGSASAAFETAGSLKMRLSRALLLAAALATMTSAASAFQEQQGAAPQTGAKPDAKGETAPPAAGIEFSSPSAPIGGGGQGTEVRIPGLGRLGVLPKMDFGLELLYGAAEPKVQDSRPDATDDDALRIRGTVKHRF